MPSPQSKSAKFWDKNARKYAASKIANDAEYQHGLTVTKTFLRPEHKVLEIGCGTGSTALAIAPHVAHLTATDISPGMIAICEEKRTESGIQNIEFSVGSNIEPVVPKPEFDAVLAFNVLHLVDDLNETFAHANAVLKPGGLFISKTVCMSEKFIFSLLRVPLVLAEKLTILPRVLFFTSATLDQRVTSAGFELVYSYTTSGFLPRRYLVAKKRMKCANS